MKTHRLKVFIKYADAIMNGTKTFEVRKNDRGYEVGDKIVFDVVTNEGYAVGAAARHPLNGATYRIDYILDDFEGLAQKYVAFSISKETDGRNQAEALPVLRWYQCGDKMLTHGRVRGNALPVLFRQVRQLRGQGANSRRVQIPRLGG